MKHFFYLIGLVCLFASCEKQDKEEPADLVKKEFFRGSAQKGPFGSGSSITIHELDAKLNQTGKIYATSIINNLGDFEQKNMELVSRYVQLKADGYYFNEVTGKTSIGPISLNALVDISESNTANINVLTHLERARVEYLVTEMKMSFTEAKKQALREVLGVFSLDLPAATTSESLNLTENAMLLAVSCILQGSLSTGDMVELMANIILDIRTDGKLDSQTLGSQLVNNAITLSLPDLRKNMEGKYAALNNAITVPDFEQYIRLFLANTSFKQSDFISYPARGAWGLNVLSEETFSVSLYDEHDERTHSYSLTADIPVGQKLRVVLKSSEWGYQALPIVNWEGGYKDNNRIIELSTSEGGKLSDMRIVPFGGVYNPVDKKFYSTIEYYENNSREPRVKTFEFHTYKMPQEIDINVINSGEHLLITDYTLNSRCQWINLNYDNKEVMLINSHSELGKYISCSQDIFSDIDFSKQTLLLASGTTKIYGFGSIFKRLVKIEDRYILDVGLSFDNHRPASKWVIAVVTDKIENTDILLHVVVN